MKVKGGAIQLVEEVDDRPVQGNVAIPVYGYTTADRPIKGGAAQPVRIVTQAEVDSGVFEVQGGEAIPVALTSDLGVVRPVLGGAAVPIYSINGIPSGAAPPAAPTGLTAVQNGADVDLAWTDNATNETGYKIYRSSDGVIFAEIDDIAADSVSYTDLAPGLGTFYYYVAAYTGAGESASNTDNLLLNGYTVTTTTSPQTHTINLFGVSASTTIYWGDGNSNAYTGTALRTHEYAIAGTYTVVIGAPLNVATFDIRDNKVTLNSADIKLMTNITNFGSTTLKGGTFNSSDIAAWTDLVIFRLFSMPIGFSGSFDSADAASLSNVSLWNLFGMPASYTIVITPTGFAGFTKCDTFSMQSNGLLQPAVNTILHDLYQASVTPRTASSGSINVAGSNAAPSGTFQPASACPVTGATDGKEVAYELLNDSCLEGFNKWATVTITT